MCRETKSTMSASVKTQQQSNTTSSSSSRREGRSDVRSGDASVKSGRSSSRGRSGKSSGGKPAAFEGAKFDKDGCCLRHDSIQLAEQVKQDGKLLWREIKMNCPKCAQEKHKSRRVTSLNNPRPKHKGSVHGMSNPLRDPNKFARHLDKEFDTPFDELGRCHHHPHVQLASKKVRGGWKILMTKCPKCIEAHYDEDVASVSSRGSSKASSKRSAKSDSRSVKSGTSKRSITSRTTAVTSGGKFDKNGCCTKHPHMQVAKKKLLGGWKELRDCPKCIDPNYDDMNDNASLSSRNSRKSTSSRRSARSTKSNSSRKGGTKTSRYAALPFDDEGYCHAHPSVRLAKKKTLGGWKVIHDICPDCAQDASSQAGSARSSRSSKKSGTGRYYDQSGSETSSQTGRSDRTGSSAASGRKKKIRVKDMKFVDENGKEGRYTGDVDMDHQPHGQGKMKYKDGTRYSGVWSEGSQVHGTKSSSKSSSASGGKSSKSDWARRDGGDSKSARSSSGGGGGSEQKRTVRKMKWMDYYGDPGEYTGEVDAQNMPNGKGSMKYDHGLVQEGLWNKGQFVEGSDIDHANGGGSQKSGQRSAQQTPPRNRSSRSGGGGSSHREKPQSSSSSSKVKSSSRGERPPGGFDP